MGNYHEGEQAIQCQAREGGPDWGSPMFTAEIPQGFRPFIREQRMLIIAAPDDDGAIWSSILAGAAGFAAPVDDRTIIVDSLPAPGDPLREVLSSERDIGILALQPETIRRIRINGKVRRDGENLIVTTEQVLGNCPKYLQMRTIVDSTSPRPGAPRISRELNADQQRWIADSDTFFIGSLSPEHGADSSHRGGQPGFITAQGPRKVAWPDYTGNSFYMTLGNIHLNPASGLLFLDWEHGHTLQLTGRTSIDWTPERRAAFPGALRVIEFDIDQVVQIDHASPLHWELHGYSRFNPPVPRTASSAG